MILDTIKLLTKHNEQLRDQVKQLTIQLEVTNVNLAQAIEAMKEGRNEEFRQHILQAQGL